MTNPAGASFKEAEVVDLYRHRPPYAAQIYQRILEQTPTRDRLLDLGCGEGKVARPMTRSFGQVTAVDPSANMIDFGKSLDNGQAENLEWIEATAEDAVLTGHFDTVTFASSIHWMDPTRLFSRLDRHLRPRHLLAIIDGDAAFRPPWYADWRRFLEKWVPEVSGQPFDSDAWRTARARHLDFVDVIQTGAFVSEPFRQTVESFILCQHSRNTFTLAKLGARQSRFHDELEAILWPHANEDGELTFQIETHLTLATRKAW